jgi:hypothetical protein
MKILIAIPAYGGNVSEKTLTGVYETTRDFVREGISVELITVVNESIIHHARSNLANFFYHNTDATHLLWVDADIGFHSSDVRKLIELNAEFAAGTYPKKTLPVRYTVSLPQEGVVWNGAHTAVKAARVGSGFVLLSRAAFERIAKKFPELRYSPRSESRRVTPAEMAGSYHYYDTLKNEEGVLMGEDYAFCERFRAAGGTIWLRPDIALSPLGSHVLPGPMLLDIREPNGPGKKRPHERPD